MPSRLSFAVTPANGLNDEPILIDLFVAPDMDGLIVSFLTVTVRVTVVLFFALSETE
ncbi:hypothetical protein [Bacillus sp. FJAT-27986]|uniref:hypothetical protein n=1 Tax=Bacillus sp. FJAT-27986 TaxID=1743146 RepID=UPI001584537D|nr:hypothetical protein [Bacillus sp. FJAT-27986]